MYDVAPQGSIRLENIKNGVNTALTVPAVGLRIPVWTRLFTQRLWQRQGMSKSFLKNLFRVINPQSLSESIFLTSLAEAF